MEAQTIGGVLKKARQQAKIELRAVADVTNIRLVYLQAIEENRFDDLPGQVYTQGFIKSYARFLNLDDKLFLDQYQLEYGEQPQKPELFMHQPVQEDRAPNRKIIWGGAGAAVLFVALWAWIGHTPQIPAVEEAETLTTPEVVQAPQVLTEPELAQEIAAVEQTNTPAEPPVPAAALAQIQIKIVEKSWIKIARPDGELVFTGLLSAGETYTVPQEPGLSMMVGNGAGVILSIDGQDLPALGRSGEVLHNIALDAEQLKTQNAG